MSVANPISSTDLKNILSSSRLRPSREYQFKEAAIDGLKIEAYSIGKDSDVVKVSKVSG